MQIEERSKLKSDICTEIVVVRDLDHDNIDSALTHSSMKKYKCKERWKPLELAPRSGTLKLSGCTALRETLGTSPMLNSNLGLRPAKTCVLQRIPPDSYVRSHCRDELPISVFQSSRLNFVRLSLLYK